MSNVPDWMHISYWAWIFVAAIIIAAGARSAYEAWPYAGGSRTATRHAIAGILAMHVGLALICLNIFSRWPT